MKPENTVLALIDVQGKLADIMYDREALYDNLQRLVRGCLALQVPIVWTEQIPQKMGPTIEPLRALLAGLQPIPKSAFSCCGEPAFVARLQALGRKHVVLAGIETHVCLYQTASDLLAAGYAVDVVADAVSSRAAANKAAGLDRIRAAGGGATSVEMLLFELMRTADHPAFRDILRIVK